MSSEMLQNHQEDSTTESQATPPQPTDVQPMESHIASEKAAKRTQTMIIVGAVIFLVALIAAVVLMATHEEATQVIRDIAIVFVAVESFLIGLALLLLVFQVQMLIQVLRDEIQPLLQSFNDTASTVRGTTEFVSHNVVSPFIKLAGVTAAARRVASNVAAVVKGTRPRSETRQNQTGGKQDEQSG